MTITDWIQKMWKKIWWDEILGIILAITIIAMIIVVARKGQTLDNVLLAGLIAVTTWYAYATIKIARATKQQAEASVKMAEEMREQRYKDSLPLLVPTIPPDWDTQGLAPNEVIYVYLQIGIGIKVMWCNVGKGVAINSRFSFWAAPISPKQANFFPPRESGTLAVGDKKEVDYHDTRGDKQIIAISDAYQPRLEAEYQDIYERNITTIQEFRIEEHDGHKRAFIGDIYFTVNGRRLGEEVMKG